MSYNINFQDLTSLYSGAATNINSWQESLTSIYEDMNYVFAQENFKGAAADSIKNYISQVHFTVISSITGLLSEYSAMLLLYLDGLYTYDAGPIANLNEDQMTELADRFTTVLGDIYESHELCVTNMNTISDLTDLGISSLETYTSVLEEAKSRLITYRDGIGEYDNDYAVNKLPSFVDRLNETTAVIEKLREIKEFDPLTYDAGNLIPLEQLQKVCENAEASYAYLEENAANIDAAVEHQQEVYAQIEEMLAQQRKEEGYRKLFMGAVILTTFVLTAGVATPVAVAGIPMVAYGSSMASEGLQDMYYGEMGDISTESFNFVRDTVFGGDQDKYDFFGAVATSAYSVIVTVNALYRPTSIGNATVSKKYSPSNPGPLSDDVANTFNGGVYTERVLTEDTVMYRVSGGNAKQVGSYMSMTPQSGGLQSQLDLALNPSWGNTAQTVTKVVVPKGTIVYEGVAAPQNIYDSLGNIIGRLQGGGNQIYIPIVEEGWFLW